MSWRDYITGALAAGPVEVVCCGRRVAVWWRDERGWQVYAGRPWGIRRDERAGTRRTGAYTLGATGAEYARMRCERCTVDVQLRMPRWSVMLDQMAEAGVTRVSLRALAAVL